jgi:hypothetical protein
MEPSEKLKTNNGMSWRAWQQLWLTPQPKDDFSEVPLEVDEDLRKDFKEAALTLKISPRASAALSRYCLQKLLRNKAGASSGDLIKEISEVVDSGKLPNHIAEQLDAIRHIGNFAAHPNEDKKSGAIIEVEDAEAEWCLETLRDLLDFYCVQPVRTQKRKAALNEKLEAAGRKPMSS